jgi:hypothetical protein
MSWLSVCTLLVELVDRRASLLIRPAVVARGRGLRLLGDLVHAVAQGLDVVGELAHPVLGRPSLDIGLHRIDAVGQVGDPLATRPAPASRTSSLAS